MNYLKRKLKTTKGILTIITILSISVIGLSYGTFIITTNKYKASELLISNLMYAINITTTGGSETINNKTVSLGSGSTSTVLVEITSLNNIDSKYSLEYNITSGTGNIYYASSTGWLPSGKISKSNGEIYIKIIKVVIVAQTNITVDFNVSGGYTYNNEIASLPNYTKITESYNKILNYTNAQDLTEIIEKETNCTGSCLYGGESINNYLQYPKTENTTKNIWRIIGTYDLNGETGIKLISTNTSTTTKENINTSLTEFYNTLEKQNDYILKTNKFNCTDTCTESAYTNIGLITTQEYNKIGGQNSYLTPTNNYFGLNNTEIVSITTEGIKETTEDTNSGLRPTIYLKSDVQVTGSGTESDPYRLSPKGDIIIASATLNGTPLETFPKKTDPYLIKGVTCTNGSVGYYDEEKETIKLTTINLPTTCTVDFKEGNQVSLSGSNVTVAAPSNTRVGRTYTHTFTVTANNGYTLENANITCNNGAIPTITNNKVTITNIKSDNTCTITVEKEKQTLITKLLEDNPTRTGQRPNAFSGVYTADNTGVMYVANGNQTEDGSNVYYFAGNAKNNWVKFGQDSAGADLYWRIIRTNEDGSVRMLYAGTSVSTTAGYISASQAYNGTYNNPMYVGYMYGTSGTLESNRTNITSSPIKTVVDNWYASGLNTKTDASGNTFDKYISQTAIYCNDRANEGYSTSSGFYYATYKRLIDAKAPSYKCGNNASGSLYTGTNGANVADKFSKNTSKGGNGKLTYPVALMTADEISFAGGLYATNAPAWYYYNSGTGSITGDKWWWTMSPCVFSGSGYAVVFSVYGSSYPGFLAADDVSNAFGVRPVVSLKSCATWKSGNGAWNTPYEVTIDNTCINNEN